MAFGGRLVNFTSYMPMHNWQNYAQFSRAKLYKNCR